MQRDDEVILIVEDSEDDRALLARAFRKANVTVPIQFAEDGDEALAVLQALSAASVQHPVVILLDLKLPRRSGFEVLEWIKAQPTLRRVPVVILTSSRESTDLARAYDLGANSYLVKPARLDTLLEMVERIDTYWLKLNQRAESGQPTVG
ncbi:response regulator [Salinarimonas soli]|uniref:Response regulator n=1 Tax=Salinarimonas soli TaxID=1638099 RepID=A0A5B2V700_9HYPH|nr:response regulator [Salinarimonas soli]KAA2234731.1 response regulator [Salinarimonas soli]